MKNLLFKITQSLVDDQEQVQVDEIEGSQTTVLELRVAKSDMARSSANRAGRSMPSGLY